MKNKGIVKKLSKFILVIVFIYAVYLFISQQRLLNIYAVEKEQYNSQIKAEEERKEELNETLKNLNSTQYIEGIARDKLDMYLPNERVYIDITK